MDTSLILWVILDVFLIAAILKLRAENRAHEQARRAYRDALAALEDDPGSTALRQAALSKGHALAEVQRRINAAPKQPRLILHDETAIRNDLDAIVASPRPASVADER